MLALTRKKGDSIMIGHDVEIIVLGVSGEQVRLGILAPRHVPVHRKEIYLQIQEENKEALNASAASVKKIAQLIQLQKIKE